MLQIKQHRLDMFACPKAVYAEINTITRKLASFDIADFNRIGEAAA